MRSIVAALVAAFRSLFNPRMVALVLWPMLSSALLWLVLAVLFWHRWFAALESLLHAGWLVKLLGPTAAADVSGILVGVVLVLLLAVAGYLTALMLTALFAMPVIVKYVEAAYYPGLAHQAGAGTLAGGVANTVFSVLVYCVLLPVCLLLSLLVPPLAALTVLLSGWLNMRLFRYDALAEHASRAEYARILGDARFRLYALGLVAGLLQFVPVFNLFLPVYMGLAFSHLSLGELQRARGIIQPPKSGPPETSPPVVRPSETPASGTAAPEGKETPR